MWCVRASSTLQKLVGRQSDPEKRASAVHLKRWSGDGRGRGSSVRQPRAKRKRCSWGRARKNAVVLDWCGISYDRIQEQNLAMQARGGPYRWKTPRIASSYYLHGSARERSWRLLGSVLAKASAPMGRSDRGARDRFCQERSEDNAEGQPAGPFQSGSGVVKRQIHRSLGRKCKLVVKGEIQVSKRRR